MYPHPGPKVAFRLCSSLLHSSSGTLEASEVLAESLVGQPVVSLTGNKVVLSTSSSSYKGVTVVNSSN